MAKNEELEKLVDSKFFEYLINEKLNEEIQKKYKKYKGIAFSVISFLILILGYLGYDNIQTNAILEINKSKVDSLNSSIEQLNVEVEIKFDELFKKHDYLLQNKSDSFNLYLRDIQIQHGYVGRQNDLLSRALSYNKENLDSKDLIFRERLESIIKTSREIQKASTQVDTLLSSYKNRLNLLDSSELITRLVTVDSLDSRIKLLEKSQDEYFSLDEGQDYNVVIESVNFNIENITTKSDQSTILINGKKLSLVKGETTLINSSKTSVYLELIESSKGGLFSKGKARYKIFSRYNSKLTTLSSSVSYP
ncbi:MAG: hypothetical protein RIB54_14520 [Fulvivirga sp.]|uniref:hypothetical protein n=1 Tax=Fulvivirga sp. TaxID=1931237 RepID=UPI0032ECE099